MVSTKKFQFNSVSIDCMDAYCCGSNYRCIQNFTTYSNCVTQSLGRIEYEIFNHCIFDEIKLPQSISIIFQNVIAINYHLNLVTHKIRNVHKQVDCALYNVDK